MMPLNEGFRVAEKYISKQMKVTEKLSLFTNKQLEMLISNHRENPLARLFGRANAWVWDLQEALEPEYMVLPSYQGREKTVYVPTATEYKIAKNILNTRLNKK